MTISYKSVREGASRASSHWLNWLRLQGSTDRMRTFLRGRPRERRIRTEARKRLSEIGVRRPKFRGDDGCDQRVGLYNSAYVLFAEHVQPIQFITHEGTLNITTDFGLPVQTKQPGGALTFTEHPAETLLHFPTETPGLRLA